MLFGSDILSFDGERLWVRLVRLVGEMNNCRLLCFKCRTTSSFPVKSLVDNCFDTRLVTLRRQACDLGCEIINKGYCSSVAVNPPLYQVRVEKEEEDWGEGNALE